MKAVVCLTLACALVCFPVTPVWAQAQTQAPGTLGGVVLQGSAVVSGSVASSSGRRLSNITMQLLDPSGVVVGKTVSTKNGEFTFPPARYETYTLQCVDDGKVIGTSSVILNATTQPVRITCTSDVAGYWQKWGVLTALGVAAAAAGTAAIVASGDSGGSATRSTPTPTPTQFDASGSR